jgi:filamentous hemagglutinin
VVKSDDNIVRKFTDEYGSFQERDSLFAGPRGFIHYRSTWQEPSEGLRFVTAIPYGKGGR